MRTLLAGVSIGAVLAGLAATGMTHSVNAASCNGPRYALKQLLACHRPVFVRYICSGIQPDDFEKILNSECAGQRQVARSCIIRNYLGGVANDPVAAAKEADRYIEEATQFTVGGYTRVYYDPERKTGCR